MTGKERRQSGGACLALQCCGSGVTALVVVVGGICHTHAGPLVQCFRGQGRSGGEEQFVSFMLATQCRINQAVGCLRD
jgi:hypothetical protein